MSLCHATEAINERLSAGPQGQIIRSASGLTLCGKRFGAPQFVLPMMAEGDSLELVARGAPASDIITCVVCRHIIDRAAEIARRRP